MINLKRIIRKKSKLFFFTLVLCNSSFAQNRLVNDSLKGFDEKSERKAAIEQGIPQSDIDGFMEYKKWDFIQKKYHLEPRVLKNGDGENPLNNPQCDVTFICDNIGVETGSFEQEWSGYTGTFPSCCPTQVALPVANRLNIVSGTGNDPFGGFPVVCPGGSYSVQLGNSINGAQAEKLVYKFKVPSTGPYNFTYKYAVVFQDPNHAQIHQPKFEITMYDLDNGNAPIPCTYYQVTSGAGIPGFQNFSGGHYKPWTTNTISLDNYLGHCVAIEFSNYDCALGGHWGYSYIDGSCFSEGILSTGTNCTNEPITFLNNTAGNSAGETYVWDFDDGSGTSTALSPVHIFTQSGTFTVTLTITTPNGCVRDLTYDITIDDCSADTIDCENCIMSFAPEIGKKYILSAWVKEVNNPNVLTYTEPEVKLEFLIGNTITQTMHFIPQFGDKIIDDWQRIEREFLVPNAEKIRVVLLNNGTPGTTTFDVLFDDIRIWPYDGSMKSFVYDPVSMKLMAELDEKNYSTFYEYDEEGALIRVKKETERGIMTIKESRNNTRKQ